MTSTRSTAQRRRARTMARQMTTVKLSTAPVEPTEPIEGWDDGDGAGLWERPTPRWPSVVGLVLCIVGLADAAYVTYAEYTSVSNLACPDTALINCGTVLTSPESHILGIPVSLLGVIFFLGMIPLMLPAAWRSTWKPLRAARLLGSAVGVGMILWFIYAELFKIGVICAYCTGVHILTFALFVVVVLGTIATAPAPES